MDYTDPTNLRFLGKKAATMHADGVPLTDAVIQAVDEKKLNSEQVRRVCEAANQAAYQGKWDEGGSVRNVSFDGGPARPEKVIEVTQAKAPAKANLKDFNSAPSKKDEDLGGVLKRIFGKSTPRPKEKTAGADPLAVSRVVAHAERDVRSKLGSVQLKLQKSVIDMRREVRRAVMDDESMGKIAAAWGMVAPEVYVREALELVRPCVRRDLRNSSFEASMDKTAGTGAVPNEAHPAISTFKEFYKRAHAMQVFTNTLLVLREEQEGLRI